MSVSMHKFLWVIKAESKDQGNMTIRQISVIIWLGDEGATTFLARTVFKKTPRLARAQALSSGE